jgi:hypothetical protein
MKEKKELKTYQELKNESLPGFDDNLDELLKKRDKFDINPNTNFQIMKKLIEVADENLKQNYINYNQTLTFEQRKEIIEKIKTTNSTKSIETEIELNVESFMSRYFKLLKNLYEWNEDKSTEKYEKIKKSLQNVDNSSIKIPLIYGTNELRYSGLISNLFQYLQKKEKNGFKEKIEFMSQFLKKILDDEFLDLFGLSKTKLFDFYKNEKFDKDYVLNGKIDSLFFHLLYMDLLICIFSLHGDSHYIKPFCQNFYETKKSKLDILQKLQNVFKFKLLETDENITFKDCNDIKNKVYLIIDSNNTSNTFKFNPYDYVLSYFNLSKINNFVEF